MRAATSVAIEMPHAADRSARPPRANNSVDVHAPATNRIATVLVCAGCISLINRGERQAPDTDADAEARVATQRA